VSQYIELQEVHSSAVSKDDPWFVAGNADKSTLEDGSQCKYLIIGAGVGGLLAAVRLIKEGIPAEEIRFVDTAGGFGGVWYWNRFPGLMCDVESYIYMPLLEEMEYMPTKRYASGAEIREYLESIVEMWHLKDNALWGTKVDRIVWNENDREWKVELTSNGTEGTQDKSFTVGAQFVYKTTGVLTRPHLPRLPGIEKFKGHSFHTSRWDYGYTGGKPEFEPELSKLKGKRVGIIGTGATGVQGISSL
jgi:cation diffusion facilitator CzcD-associated flavoprotein CzcO